LHPSPFIVVHDGCNSSGDLFAGSGLHGSSQTRNRRSSPSGELVYWWIKVAYRIGKGQGIPSVSFRELQTQARPVLAFSDRRHGYQT